MADEKVYSFPAVNGRGNRFTAENQPDHNARGEKVRAMNSVKQALMNAFDKLGNEAFFVQLGRGSAEDKRCLAMILAKLLPIEVQGALDAALTVRVVTQLSEFPQDAAPTPALPVASGKDRAPSGPHEPPKPPGHFPVG